MGSVLRTCLSAYICRLVIVFLVIWRIADGTVAAAFATTAARFSSCVVVTVTVVSSAGMLFCLALACFAASLAARSDGKMLLTSSQARAVFASQVVNFAVPSLYCLCWLTRMQFAITNVWRLSACSVEELEIAGNKDWSAT